jgi:hypothetical protein
VTFIKTLRRILGDLAPVGGFADVDPGLGSAGEGLLGGEFEAVGVHGALDGVGGGVDGDLDLLVPELGLAVADLVVHPRGLVAQLHVLLAELEEEQGDDRGGEDADQQLEHGRNSEC